MALESFLDIKAKPLRQSETGRKTQNLRLYGESVAADVYQQKLAEGQEIAEAVLDAEVRLGELRSKVQRDVGGRPEKTMQADLHSFEKEKTQLASFDERAQITKWKAPQYETLAAHPAVVERVKAEARENGEIVTRQAVLKAEAFTPPPCFYFS